MRDKQRTALHRYQAASVALQAAQSGRLQKSHSQVHPVRVSALRKQYAGSCSAVGRWWRHHAHSSQCGARGERS